MLLGTAEVAVTVIRSVVPERSSVCVELIVIALGEYVGAGVVVPESVGVGVAVPVPVGAEAKLIVTVLDSTLFAGLVSSVIITLPL